MGEPLRRGYTRAVVRLSSRGEAELPIRLYAVVLVAIVGCEQSSTPEPQDSPAEASSAAAESTDASAATQSAEGESSSDGSTDNSPNEPSDDSSARPGAKGDAPPSQAPTGDADGESAADSSAASGGDNPTSNGASARPQGVAPQRRFGTPSEAATFAQGRFDAAKSMWDPKAAIQTALEGWQAVNQHEGDPKCRALAEQLLVEMQRRDRQVSSAKKGDPLNDLPLQIK